MGAQGRAFYGGPISLKHNSFYLMHRDFLTIHNSIFNDGDGMLMNIKRQTKVQYKIIINLEVS